MALPSRLSNSIRSRDWGSALLDVGIVAVGILMALAVDEWREERSKRAKEQLVLSTLRSDVAEAQKALQQSLRDRQAWMAFFADMRSSAFGLTQEARHSSGMCNSLGPSHIERWSAPGLPAFEELIAAGTVSSIESPEIRKAALQYLSSKEVVEKDRERLEFRALDLPKAFPELITIQLKETDDPEDLDGLDVVLRCDVLGMRQSDRFRAALQANFAGQTMALYKHRLILAPQLDVLRDVIEGHLAPQGD